MFNSVIQTTPTAARRRRRVVEWQNLPADILLMIAQRSEIRQLRAVCSSWRYSLPLPYKAHHPLLSTKIPLPPLFDRDEHLYRDNLADPHPRYLTLTECNIYCLEPLGNDDADSPESCWIVKLEEMSSGKMRFHHPLTYWSIPASRLNLPAAVDFLDCRINLVGKEYAFRVKHNLFYSCKVVLSDDAMLCLFDETMVGYFKFGDERWTKILDRRDNEHAYVKSMRDIIYHKRNFYVVNVYGQIIVIDSSSLKVEIFVYPSARVDQGGQHCYGLWDFVQSDGDLFVVYKWNIYRDGRQNLVQFKVYRLNSDEQQWNEVTNLGDQSFFINDGCTFSIGSQQFFGCGQNFIYFRDERKSGRGRPDDKIGIFSLEDNSSLPLHMSRRYSRLFWPIPSWLKQG